MSEPVSKRDGQRIEVKISVLEMLEWRGAELAPMYIIDKLRKAGIPIKGILVFQGIERGNLIESNDLLGGLEYLWIS